MPLVMLAISAAVLGPIFAFLFVVNYIAELKSLRSQNVPRPTFVLWRRIRGAVAPSLAHSGGAVAIGQHVWLSWDVRWTAAGRSLGRVVAFDSATRTVELELKTPISLGPDEAPVLELQRVRFVPLRPNWAAYQRKAVAGHVEPAIEDGLWATAVLVVYADD